MTLKNQPFLTTSWTVVLEAAGDSDTAEKAMEELCRQYWPPLYTFVRHKVGDIHLAQDLTQEFLSRFLQSNSLQTVTPEKGKFRTFLLSSLKNFLANDLRDSRRIKRGGQCQFVSWEELQAEEARLAELETDPNPESAFDRKWAAIVVSKSIKSLEAEMKRDEIEERFQILKPYLQAGQREQPYSELAARLKLSEGGVKTLIFRMRRRLGELIRQEIADTVHADEDVEGEIRYLISILAGGEER